ncbi:PAS domain-containing sensor histidine kinase [Nostoc sp. FACHB-110]|uniref:sensor histidine kinase n=1 Tax=Nostoc sp. FACHB-110 TaxID=2692834 RepID=UPI001F551DBC|nr:PAS domain-containing sensor histidine kinase [Nostoc sp. FACHB-110]
MASLLQQLARWCKQVFSTPTIDVNTAEYQSWRTHFLWQRLRLWLWLALICLLSFTVRNIYDLFFPLQELAQLPKVIRIQGVAINIIMLLSLLVCFGLHKTQFGHRHPGRLFLGISWSISFTSQLFATINGFALPDNLGWSLLFLSQAIFMPVRWLLHLLSQLGILIYFFAVNTALGLKPILPGHLEIYNVTFILYIFWFCTICDVGVYLYDRLQYSEFNARQALEAANKKLALAEAKYRSIFENAIEGIFQSSPDGRYITANPALAKIYGYSSPEEVTANFTDIENQLYVDSSRRAEFVRLIEKYGIVAEFESQIYRQDKSVVWISEKAYAVRDAAGKLLYYEGLIEDITQRKQAEEAVRVFFHAVSHDLRNPVLGSLMVLRNLLNANDTSSQIPISRAILERMEQSCDRQLSLLNSLMEAHTNEVQGVVLQLQPLQLYTVVANAIADLEPMLTKNQTTLSNLVTADLPSINADPTQLWRVFSNLIGNAIKHNPPGLHITINAQIQSDKIYCTVSDNGVGISKQQSDRLFDLYFRGNNRNSVGLGLGLYLCKQIIHAHGGEIGLENGLEAGATFWFTLPLNHPA